MRQENAFNTQSSEDTQTSGEQAAFLHLKSLPRNHDRPALDSYKRERSSTIIDEEVAEEFTNAFRNVDEPFYIPVSWTLTKSALVNLLGITSYSGYEEVNGVRFYAGLNTEKQLTLIAVSTREGEECNDDLTADDEYPYYDYADPCPNNCSNRGNLKALSAVSLMVQVTS